MNHIFNHPKHIPLVRVDFSSGFLDSCDSLNTIWVKLSLDIPTLVKGWYMVIPLFKIVKNPVVSEKSGNDIYLPGIPPILWKLLM